MTVAWVIGGGGLIGTALRAVLEESGAHVFVPAGSLNWTELTTARAQLIAYFHAFERAVAEADRWEIYWAAGRGTMHSREVDMEPETALLAALCAAVAKSGVLGLRPGGVAFTSSAGAVYGGSDQPILTECSDVAPANAYARAKLKQENAAALALASLPACSVLLARVSTVYGPAQAAGKAQGLLSHIARCIVRNQPVHVYVPLDTIRDYIAVADAAREMTLQLRQLTPGQPAAVRLIASERPTTISEIVGLFKHLSWRPPRLVTCAAPAAAAYKRRIQFRSRFPPCLEARARTSLPVGISRLLADARAQLALGERPVPRQPASRSK